MDTAIRPLTAGELTNVGISAVIAKAAKLSRDPELDKWKDVYEPAKQVIAEMGLTTEEYQAVVALLTEALRI